MTWAAVIVFAIIFCVVFFGFQETRALVCDRYKTSALVAIFRGQDQSCTVNFLSEFQTLITGVLALAGAAVTILQMRKSDRRQWRVAQLAIERFAGELLMRADGTLSMIEILEKNKDNAPEWLLELLKVPLGEILRLIDHAQSESGCWTWLSFQQANQLKQIRSFVAKLDKYELPLDATKTDRIHWTANYDTHLRLKVSQLKRIALQMKELGNSLRAFAERPI